MADLRRLSILAALDWAFVTECASMDIGRERKPVGMSTEYLLMQRAELGGVRVDTSRGRSSPHDDAQALAWIVARLPAETAQLVEDYSRAGHVPDWMPGARPRLVPREWNTKSRHGMFGKTEVLATYVETFTQPHPRNRRATVTRRRTISIEWTPCTWEPSKDEIRDVRAIYTRWQAAIAIVKERAQATDLRSILITDEMPPAKPWK